MRQINIGEQETISIHKQLVFRTSIVLRIVSIAFSNSLTPTANMSTTEPITIDDILNMVYYILNLFLPWLFSLPPGSSVPSLSVLAPAPTSLPSISVIPSSQPSTTMEYLFYSHKILNICTHEKWLKHIKSIVVKGFENINLLRILVFKLLILTPNRD